MRREYLSREKEILGKLKTKRLLKVTILDEQEVLSTIKRQNQSSASLKLRKYVFAKTWKVAVTACIYIWK